MKVLKSHFITRLRKYYGELWINMPDPGNQYFARVSILPENHNLAKDVLYLAHQIPDDIGDSKYKDVFIFSCDNMKEVPDSEPTAKRADLNTASLMVAIGENDFLSLSLNSLSVFLELAQNNDALELEASSESLLRGIIDGNYLPEELLKTKLKSLNMDFQNLRYLIVIRDKTYGKYSKNKTSIYNDFSAEEDITFFYNKDLIIILRSADKAKTVLRLEELETIIQSKDLIAGCSWPVDGIMLLSKSYHQACLALEFGYIFAGNSGIHYYNDYVYFDLIKTCVNPKLLDRLTMPTLNLLKQFDRENNAHLMETLDVYLKNNCSLKNTADILHYHKNTIYYRIEKCKEILDVNFNNTQDLYNVYLSLCIDKYLYNIEDSQMIEM